MGKTLLSNKALFLLIISCNLFAARLLWWTTGSGASGAEEGTTVGQAFIGDQVISKSYGYWVDNIEPILCVSIATDIWDIDSTNIGETISMIEGEEIIVTNCGNCHENYGLTFEDSSPLLWEISYAPAGDRFVLRARFSDTSDVPAAYDHSRDFIKDIVTWAHGFSFGDAGYAIPVGETRRLWLQYVSPASADIYGGNQITITLYCQLNIH